MIAVVLLLGLTLGPDEGAATPASVAAERALDDAADSSSGSQRRRSAQRDTAASEDERRSAGVGGYVSALNIDSGTAVSFSGSLDYRFTRVVGLEIDATLAPRLESSFPGYAILTGGLAAGSSSAALGGPGLTAIYPGPTYTNPGGRAVILSNNVRITIPTTAARVEPYFVAGGGIGSVRHTADFVYNPIVLTSNPPIGVAPTIRPITQRVTSSSIDMALTLGGGVGIRTVSQLWIEADLRLVRLLGNTDTNVGRFGVGARYRF
jgi:opacity protein-like surface antigen